MSGAAVARAWPRQVYVAVVVSKEEFDRRRRPKGPRGSVLSFLRSLSLTGAVLDLERSKDVDRDVEI